MTKKAQRLLIVFGALAGAAALAAMTGVVRVRPVRFTCKSANDLGAAERDAIEGVARELVTRSLGPDPGSAYPLFATSARSAGLTTEQLVATSELQRQQFGAIRDLTLTRLYVVEVTGTSDDQQVICGSVARAEERVVVMAKGGPRQAHVVIEGESPHGAVAFVLWLVQGDGAWRALETHARRASYLGKDTAAFEHLAKEEEQSHHLLNAALLFSQAQAVGDLGPRMQLGIIPRIVDEFQAVKVPGPLAGAPPFSWNVGEAQFRVLSVSPLGLDDGKGHDKLWVVVQHEIDPWVDDEAELTRRNRQLIAAFRERYPSYKRVFAGLAARAQPKDRGQGARMYGTVHVEDEVASESPTAPNQPE
jgi:hypothetical protein